MYKLNVLIISIINIMYVFRSLSVSLKIESGIYALSIILIIFNFINSLKRLHDIKINYITMFVITGLIAMVLSFITYNPMVSIIGYGVLFLNLFLWNFFLKNIKIETLNMFFNYFIKLNSILACITALLGVYQYFIDSSLWGMALHEIYGNIELMESGRFVKRATGFMGSPQNYSLYIALMTCFIPFLNFKKKWKFMTLAILLLGGAISGSRAYVVFVLQTLMLIIFLNTFYKIKDFNKFIKNFLLILISMLAIVVVFNINLQNRTFSRMLTFINDWPALQIYIKHLSTVDLSTIWFGKGMGVNERVVVQLLGSKYNELVGIYTYSYESFILSLFMQSGIFTLSSFLLVYISSLRKVFTYNKIYFSILLSILVNLMFTPSFNGFTMSFIIWPFILLPFYFKKPILLKKE